MLTPEQERWIAHLSDTDRIRIVPFDPTAESTFEGVRRRIHDTLGSDIPVEHHGATSLGISGQDEIDVYVPIPATQFDEYVARFALLFGEPTSRYAGRRAHFVDEQTGKHVDIFVINADHDDWRNLQRFEAYLRAHPGELERYRLLKEQGHGLSGQAYYRRKLEFVNEILARLASGSDSAGTAVTARPPRDDRSVGESLTHQPPPPHGPLIPQPPPPRAPLTPQPLPPREPLTPQPPLPHAGEGEHGPVDNVVAVDPVQPDPAVIERAAAIIRRGGLVAFPTETVYGLGANALDAEAVRGIFAAKGRALNDPLIVHLASADDLPRVVAAVPPVARALAARFWPGPLTLVLPKQPAVPDVATAGLPTVAVRVPSHPVAQALIRAAGLPIAAPSANRFMRTSATLAGHVVEDLGDRVDLILDGGPAPHGIESTVVAVDDGEVRLLRPGATTPEALAEALAALDPPVPLLLGAAGRAASPGLLAKHYSPRAALFLLTGERTETRPALRAAVERGLHDGRRVGVLLLDEDAPLLADLSDRARTAPLGSERDLAAVAGRLFAAMRALDAVGCDAIYARTTGAAGLGLAIVDRLTRAAHPSDA